MQTSSELNLHFSKLFCQLKQAGFPLGICEYNLLVEALQTEIYDPLEPESLKQLLETIWVKTRYQKQQFADIFQQLSPQKSDSTVKISQSSKPDTDKFTKNPQTSTTTPTPIPEKPTGKSFFFPATSQKEVDDKTIFIKDPEVGKAVRTSRKPDFAAFKPTANPKDYLPVTGQQMVQSWYNLRHSARSGNRLELDIPATIEQIKRQGKLAVPVEKPPRIKYSSLLLLIDQRGSMQPFHVLSRQLVATAEQTGCLQPQNCYYFHNYPDSELYCDSQFNVEIATERVLAELSSQHTVVLIFSDAGAARRGYIPRRIEETESFLKLLKSQVKTIVWLNPLPESVWHETTAAAVAKLPNIKMFAADREGFQKAIELISC
ncbi:MAG: hypothetical protein ACRC62_04170 [Microcoleus sp.]